MIYLFERAEKRIKRNIKKYFPIIIQVILVYVCFQYL